MPLRLKEPSTRELLKLRAIADYQFGPDSGCLLFPDHKVKIVKSAKTGRIRYVYVNGSLVATIRPEDGYLTLTIKGARTLLPGLKGKYTVQVKAEAIPAIKKGRSVFAKHVVAADTGIRPGDEVFVVNGQGSLVAVGRAVLNGEEMVAFKSGIAVKTRRGVEQ